MKKADIREANLQGAKLDWVKMEGADLRGADLRGASMTHTFVRGTKFDERGYEYAKSHGAHFGRDVRIDAD